MLAKSSGKIAEFYLADIWRIKPYTIRENCFLKLKVSAQKTKKIAEK
jgi:hypothetical protein